MAMAPLRYGITLLICIKQQPHLFFFFIVSTNDVFFKKSSFLFYRVIWWDGKFEVLKEQVEFDDEKLMLVQIGFEGNVFDHYKVFKMTYQVVPKNLEHSTTIMTLEYEKLDDGSPYPYKYLDLMNRYQKHRISP